MPKRILFVDEELFVMAFCRAVEEGDKAFVTGHVKRLEGLIGRLNDCLRELSEVQYRAHQMKGHPGGAMMVSEGRLVG